MTGIILSGGRNRRMGENKAFLQIQGERLIDRTVRLFRSLFREVIVVTGNTLDYLDVEATVVADLLPGKGALGGIYTGLFYAAHERAFVAACDMPFLDREFIASLAARAADFDIVVPETEKGFQPLHAVYARRCLPVIRGLLDRDRLKITGFYPGHRLCRVSLDEICRFAPGEKMFLNINTPEEWMDLCGRSGWHEAARPKEGSHV